MKISMTHTARHCTLAAIILALPLVLIACNSSSEGAAIDHGQPLVLPNLQIYFARTIPIVERFDAVDIMREKQDTLNTTVVSLVLAIQLTAPNPAQPRRVYVHSESLINGPYSYNTQGYVDLNRYGNHYNDIHVTLGRAREVPDFLHQYTHSIFYPYEHYDQAPTFFLNNQTITLWSFVAAEEDIINRKWRFLRGVP